MSAINPFAASSSDNRPLPEIIAERYGFKLQHVDDLDMRYYAVQDWIAGVTGVKDAKTVADTWRGLKRDRRKNSDSDKRPTLKLADMVISMPYRATDGKTYQRDYADAATLNVITQRLNASTPLAESLRAFLAKAGVLADDIRRNPSAALEAGISGLQSTGKDDAWVNARAQGVIARNHFTAALKSAIPDITDRDYARATNGLYRGLWERTAAELKAEMGLKPTDKLRDHQSVHALGYQMIAEGLIAERLGERQSLSMQEAEHITNEIASLIGSQAAQTSHLLGRDIATNKPLLKGKR